MNVHTLDWLANNNGFYSGVVIRNQSHTPEPVLMSWSRNEVSVDGTHVLWALPAVSEWEILQPLSGYIFPQHTNSCGSLTVIGSDGISVVATTMQGQGGIPIFLPVREAKTLQEAIPAYPIAQRSTWTPSPCWNFRPMSALPYNRILQQQVVQFAAMQVFHEFPDRNDRLLGVYDACHATAEETAGHPGNSHGASHSLGLDVAYYTLGQNHTQGAGATQIWNGTVLGGNFDIVRNARFFSLIKKYLPESVLMVDRRIALAQGMPTSIFQLDDPELWNHHLHCHMALGEKINWSAPI